MTSMKIPMPGQLLQLHLQDEYFPRLTIQYINLGIEGAVRHALKKRGKFIKCVYQMRQLRHININECDHLDDFDVYMYVLTCKDKCGSLFV